MEARRLRGGVFTRLGLLAVLLLASMGARRQNANFIVETADPAYAEQVVRAAERYRHDLAVEWLGKALPDWAQPCVLTVQAAPHLGNGGATTFVFDRGEVFGWRMSIQGSRERILDSVLPHEVTHMIFASHFRRPLPRWADEGGATSVEHHSERNKYKRILDQSLRTGRGIAFNRMFAMTEYPRDIMPLYAQGHSLADYLIQIGGRRKYVQFIGDGLETDDWPGAVSRNYGVEGLGQLQNTWLAWVKQGFPALRLLDPRPAAPAAMLASAGRRPRPEPNLIHHVPNSRSADGASDLVPVNISRDTRAASAPEGIASSTPVNPPKELPASGWRAIGSPSPPPPEVSSTQVAHPQPVERP